MAARSRAWRFGFLAVVAACLLLVLLNLRYSEMRPSGPWGMGYGVGAALLLAGAALYPLRRRAPARGPGATRHWLQFHLYGGTLFLLLVLMHTGFRLPTGGLDWALWLLSLWVVASGLAGVLIQRWIPPVLTSGLSTEVHFERIEELAASLRERAAELAQGSGGTLRDFFEQELAPVLAAPRPRLTYFLDVTGGIRSQARRFRYVGRLVPPEEAERLEQLEALFVSKLELDAHYTLQRALRWWLYGHVPFSLLLLALFGLHLFFVTYY